MSHRLIGNWTLVSYVTENPDGSRGKPYGNAVGRLSYDEHGHMAGQVMRPGRVDVAPGEWGAQQVRSAYAGYIAYFGTYEVSAAGDSVVHHVQGALNPGWVGGDQLRRMRFDGDLLILSTEVPKARALVNHVLTWRKLP
ncbi:MAG: lipocalin-like domain-containing protein [Acidobacteria bacterium]|nr:lipocalin-like domain-containing protein [Acidobacteriota bacterium]